MTADHMDWVMEKEDMCQESSSTPEAERQTQKGTGLGRARPET
jgi:hypothetical protein